VGKPIGDGEPKGAIGGAIGGGAPPLEKSGPRAVDEPGRLVVEAGACWGKAVEPALALMALKTPTVICRKVSSTPSPLVAIEGTALIARSLRVASSSASEIRRGKSRLLYWSTSGMFA
jgi:hypothetical protein